MACVQGHLTNVRLAHDVVIKQTVCRCLGSRVRRTRSPAYDRSNGLVGNEAQGAEPPPKVGTRLANEQELRDRRAEALHPFAGDPRRRGGTAYQITAIIVAVVVLIGVIALIAAT